MIPTMPVLDPLAEGAGLVTSRWRNYLAEFVRSLNAAPERLKRVQLTLQGAAIAPTSVPTPVLTAGLYLVSYNARVTRAATTSSSLTVTIRYTDGGVACALAGAAMTGNTTATVQSGVYLLRVDQSTTVQYETAYASVGATSMLYALDVYVAKLPT